MKSKFKDENISSAPYDQFYQGGNIPSSNIKGETLYMRDEAIFTDYTFRMSELEKSVFRIDKDLGEIKSNYASKEYLSEKLNSNFKWLLAIILGVAAGGYALHWDTQKETNQRFLQVYNRFQQMDEKLHSTDVRLTKVEVKLDSIDTRLAMVEKKVDSIDDKLDILIQQKQAKR